MDLKQENAPSTNLKKSKERIGTNEARKTNDFF